MTILKKEFTRVMAAPPEKRESGWTACYDLKGDFAAFAGHFPEYPLLPAFAQVDMAGHMLEKALGKKLALTGIGNAKFTGQVRPDSRLRLECAPVDSPRGGAGWDCRVSSAPLDALADSGAAPDANDSAVWRQAAKFRVYFAEQA